MSTKITKKHEELSAILAKEGDRAVEDGPESTRLLETPVACRTENWIPAFAGMTVSSRLP
jgi:hypothetical protein